VNEDLRKAKICLSPEKNPYSPQTQSRTAVGTARLRPTESETALALSNLDYVA
jgi:hypothetical protein